MKIEKLIKLFRTDLKDICEDNEVMKDEIDLYFDDKLKELRENER